MVEDIIDLFSMQRASEIEVKKLDYSLSQHVVLGSLIIITTNA